MAADIQPPQVRTPVRREMRRAIDIKAFVQGTCLVLIEVAGFAASTLLIVLGLPLFAFLFLAGWDFALLFAQLGNLAEHYREAGPTQRLFFNQDLKAAFLIASGGFALLRIPAFLRCLTRKLAEGEPDNG